jgi:hypothetical protein
MRLLSLFLSLSVVSSAAGQTILGRARDKGTGAPLRNIEIDLVPDTGASLPVLARTTTDTGGVFFIDAPALGTYRLMFNVPAAALLSGPIAVQRDVVQHEFRLDIAGNRDYYEFVVDTTGKAEMRTFKALRSTHAEFTFEVRAVVPRMDFSPAVLHGRKVRQLVQMPFHFCLNGGPPIRPIPDTSKYYWVMPVGPGVCTGGR